MPDRAMLSTLFPGDVRLAAAGGPSASEPLLPGEQTLIANASPKRRQDFALGRTLARRALAELGVTGFPLLANGFRAPVWPAGIAGTISHCEGLCAAAVVKTGAIRGIGLDVEVTAPLPADVVERVCSGEELARLPGRSSVERMHWATLVFSAKEAVYKALNPMTGVELDFLDLEILLRPDDRSFEVVFATNVAPDGLELFTSFVLDERHVATGVTVGTRERW